MSELKPYQYRPEYLKICAFIVGFSALGLQILVYREELASFQGNEFTISVMLGSWLIWTGLGSISGRRIFRNRSYLVLELIFLGLCITAPVTLNAFHFIRVGFDLAPGELTSLNLIGFSNLIFLGPFCFLSGMGFSILANLAHDMPWHSRGPGKIYLYEAVGGTLAAIIHRLWLAGSVSSITLVLLLMVILSVPLIISPGKRFVIIGLTCLIFGVCLLWGSIYYGIQDRLDTHIFSPLQIIAQEETPYGQYHLLRLENEVSILHNQSLLTHSNSPRSDEESVHIPLSIHPSPREILILEGGFGGIITEILKHPVKAVTRVTLDDTPRSLAERYAPELITGLDDLRVKTREMDCRQFVAHAPAESTDIVISCVPEPGSLGISRFYSREFYSEIHRILKPGGIFSFRIRSSDSFLNQEHRRYLALAYHSAGDIFGRKNITIIPGEPADFIIFKDSTHPDVSAETILKTLADRGIESFYVSDGYLPFRMSTLRMDDIINQMAAEPEIISTDLHPGIFVAFLRFWSRQFSSDLNMLPEIRLSMQRMITGYLVILSLSILVIRRRALLTAMTGCVFSVGFTLISLEILLAFLLQLSSGAAYQKIGLLLGIFSAGLAGGSYIGSRLSASRQILLNYTLASQWLLIFLLGGLTTAYSLGWQGSEFGLNVFSFSGGFLGAFHFVQMSRIRPDHAGYLYGMDLLGSAAGAFALACILFPNLGIPGIMGFLMAFLAVTSISLVQRVES